MNKDVHPVVLESVKLALQLNIDQATIRSSLAEKGWSPDDVDQAFLLLNQDTASPQQPKASEVGGVISYTRSPTTKTIVFVGIGLSLLVLGGLAVFYFFRAG